MSTQSIAGAVDRSLLRRLAGQGAILSSTFAAGQVCSFARNAALGHALSKGDFGVGATILLALQTLDIATDLATDRMILQDADGDDPRLLAVAHLAQLTRGIATAVLLCLAGPLIAQFFNVNEVNWAFSAAAVVPLVKGLTHLDCRRMQRGVSHGPFAATELGAQLAALILTVPLIWARGDFMTVVWLAIAQTLAGVIISHAVAERPYRIGYDRRLLARIFRFGCPVLLGALPLIAVYHGERMLIGHFRGVEELAGYTAAFLITMVPGLIVSKLALSLMLPVLAARKNEVARFNLKSRLMFEAGSVLAASYVVFFAVAGNHMMALTFGAAYGGLGPLVTCLAIMFAVRMVQAGPGTVLMSLGDTRSLLFAGLLRAVALGLALEVAARGGGLAEIAAAGVAGEVLSLLYVAWRLEAVREPLGAAFLARTVATALPIGIAVGLPPATLLGSAGSLVAIGVGLLAACGAACLAIGLSPSLLGMAARQWRFNRQGPAAARWN